MKIVDARLNGQVWDWLKARDKRPRPEVKDRPRAEFVSQPTNAAIGAPELLLYAEIGMWGVTAEDVAYALDGYNGDLHVRINSPGGDVFDGYAIYNMLASLDGTVTVTVEGLAASAASFIAMAGDQIRVQLASQMMIHDASGLVIGNAAEMHAFAAVLDSVSDTIAGVYANRAGGDPAEWRAVMKAERWYTPQEAVDAKLADQILNPKAPAEPDPAAVDPAAPPENRWDLSVFQYAGRPAFLDATPQPPEPTPAPVSLFDPDVFRTAVKEAAK